MNNDPYWIAEGIKSYLWVNQRAWLALSPEIRARLAQPTHFSTEGPLLRAGPLTMY